MGDPRGDPHEILGLRPDATRGEIRKAYRRLAMRWHPDRNPDDPGALERFKEIQWAYSSLMARDKRPTAPPGPGSESISADPDHPFWSFFSALRNHMARFASQGSQDPDSPAVQAAASKGKKKRKRA